jgi:hypothetical protein
MAITPNSLDALPDLTDTGLLKATRQAIAQITLTGTARAINGRSLTTANLPDLWAQVRNLESRIGAADGTGTVAYVQFNDPR